MSEGPSRQTPDTALRILGAAFAGVLFIMAMNAPWPSPCEKPQQLSSTHHNEGPTTNLSATTASHPGAPTTYYQCDEKDADWWLVRLAGLAALIGALQFLMFYRQWRVMYEGLGDTKKAADAALATAEAAKAQANALIKSEKPYVFVEVLESGVDISGDGSMRFSGKELKFQFVNYGRTPALLNEFFEDYPVVEGLKDGPTIIDPNITRGRLLPDGAVVARDVPHVLTTGLMTNTNAMRLYEPDAWNSCRLWFRGFIRYNDTFGTSYVKGFTFLFVPTHNRWILRGGKLLNYTRVEDATAIPPHPLYEG